MRMRTRIGWGIVLCAGLGLSVQTAWADLRCGTELVLEGDTKQTLLEACGEPDEGSAEMHTDVWVYRIGGEEYTVHLINEMVERIDAPDMSKETPPPDPSDEPSLR